MLRISLARTMLAISFLGALPLSSPAEPLLVPIPWTSVRIGRDRCWGVTDTVEVTLFCSKSQGGCLSEGASSRTIQATPVSGVVDVSDGPFRALAVLTNELDGNRWSAGVSYLKIEGPTPAVGSLVEESTVTTWAVYFTAYFRGEATLPTYEGVNTSDIFMRGARKLSGGLWAQSSEACGPLTAGVDSYLAGDSIVLERRLNSHVSVNVQTTSQGSSRRVSAVETSGFGPCGSPTPNTATDCLDSLELFSVPPPNAVSAKLACRSDLNSDGTVNFGDLAKLKSVFFQRCTP